MENEFDKEKQQDAVNDFKERMNEFKEEDVKSTAQDGELKFKRLWESIPKPLLDLWDDIKELISLLKDFASKRYTDIPLKSIIAIGAAVAYFVSPFDIIPDAIPIIGYLDDALVLKFAMDLIVDDLIQYKAWKAEKREED
ncbi:DUF1232 domain-containing protein [Thiospirochaeta perfilievii]|uniref:DUF1232 domain-containing protein n=1 Tax=Thiospirochaeta perfilievii TaxID=252967 RepID=A0A5C1Q9K5_9SPIO|nr:DUF1232 domain-containing protein [Thiospirochaeta perfilievii]QEN03324.1 DUF1232 domain-containing protein [Thiospirochaeta perfilievii]